MAQVKAHGAAKARVRARARTIRAVHATLDYVFDKLQVLCVYVRKHMRVCFRAWVYLHTYVCMMLMYT